jgi:hypothetical protein
MEKVEIKQTLIFYQQLNEIKKSDSEEKYVHLYIAVT